MKTICLTLSLCLACLGLMAQLQTFDITTFKAPAGWKKQATASAVQFSKKDASKTNYCIISVLKAVPGSANSKKNFDAAWGTVVKEMVTVSTAPEMQPPVTENGWEAQTGYASFESDGSKGVVMLVTSTGFESSRKVAINWLPVPSHHRAYRSVHGGLLEEFHLVFGFPIVIVGKAYIP